MCTGKINYVTSRFPSNLVTNFLFDTTLLVIEDFLALFYFKVQWALRVDIVVLLLTIFHFIV